MNAENVRTSIQDRILAGATRLFAQLGYDETSTRMVAEVVGVNAAEVSAYFGSKRDLYLAVMERAHKAEQAVLEGAAADFTPDLAGVHLFIDRYLDFCVANPEIPGLWTQRRLSDAADIAEMEKLYILPAGLLGANSFRQAARPGVDVEFAVWMTVWCIHNFVQGGVLNAAGERRGPEDPKALAWFRHELKLSVGRTLGIE